MPLAGPLCITASSRPPMIHSLQCDNSVGRATVTRSTASYWVSLPHISLLSQHLYFFLLTAMWFANSVEGSVTVYWYAEPQVQC